MDRAEARSGECMALLKAELSNSRRTHSGKEDEEKEEQGLLGALIWPSPASLPPPPPAPRVCCTACGYVIRIS